MVSPAGFISYYEIQVDYVLSWFPVRAWSGLTEVRVRGNHFSHRSTGFSSGVGVGSGRIHTLGQGIEDGDNIGVGFFPVGFHPVPAFITVGVDANLTFEVGIEISIGSETRKADYVLDEEMRIPFTFTVVYKGDEEIIGGTAASLQGVLVTGPRLLTHPPHTH